MKITVTDDVAREIQAEYATGKVTYRALGEKYGLSRNAIWHTVRHRKTMEARYKERFWGHVQKGVNCWEWQGAKDAKGYGQMSLYGQAQYAHRLVWEWTYGPIPSGFEICHSCDNPSCVNPAHLFLGTHEENMRDMAVKERWTVRQPLRGSANGNAKLTWDRVAEIRHLYDAGLYSQRELARAYSVGKTTIARIINRETWLDKPEPPAQ